MRVTHNPNCDGEHCTSPAGEVRLYPLGGGANLILCQACAAHENKYRYERGRATGQPNKWPQINWFQCEVYK